MPEIVYEALPVAKSNPDLFLDTIQVFDNVRRQKVRCAIMWERLFISLARQSIRMGTLDLTLPDGRQISLGDGEAPMGTIHIHDSNVFRKFLRHPEVAMGETYMDGTMTVPNGDLKALLTVLLRNSKAGNLPPMQAIARRARVALRHLSSLNSLRRSQRNVELHYDLPVEFFDLFMEEDKQYTCAYFRHPDETLEQAQANKKRHIAKKLLIEPGMRVLDIGSGWGGLAITLAQDFGALVTGVTLSQVQLDAAALRVRDAGVGDQIEFRLQDYRNVAGRFDRVVSVGMMEHVGKPQYPAFFNKIANLLEDDGVAVVQYIGRSSPPDMISPWFSKYIFPGGYTPSLSEVIPAVENSGLHLVDLEVWRGQYERTLQHWQGRFEGNIDKISELVDKRFERMWRYYLNAAELGFSEKHMVLHQMQLSKQRYKVPPTRDYLYGTEDTKVNNDPSNSD